ncbi:MAG: ParB/RepB/Spo0J family partition protein [Gammaproteobacteria bacterium]|nr:ParB/RepB/Spo0J family partition protein [Gammaproteobacteria bacterium]
MTRRGLQRGLNDLGVSALLSDIQTKKDNQLKHLSVDALRPGKYQPRREMDQEALEDLASSIKAQGIIQPIVVRSVEDSQYEIIAGERRWRAAQLASLDKVPVIIRDIPDEAAIAMSLIENIQRENLNVIEEAVALQRLIDEFHMTHQEVAESVGRSRTAVTNILRLLSLSQDVKTMVERGDLEMGHARAILVLSDINQLNAAKLVVAKGLSVRETERLVKKLQEQSSASIVSEEPQDDPNITRLQRLVSDNIGAKVVIKHAPKGSGRMVIHYNNLDELDGVLARLGLESEANSF